MAAAAVLRLKSNPCLLLLLVVMVLIVVVLPTVRAHIAEFDEYWKEREKQAKLSAINVFQTNPVEVSNEFNYKVASTIPENNGTVRRSLRGYKQRYKGPCLATNPIDKCWRCRGNWAAHRKRLADCAIGFGRGTKGGKKGSFYFVHDSSDDDLINPKPGTLRHAVIQLKPLWILFSRSMIISLKQELIVTSHKTIDGRGVNVHIAYGAGITVQFATNVIIHGLHIHDIFARQGGMIRDSINHYGQRTRSDGDAISIFGSTLVWIDHNSMWNCQDGLIDVIEGSTGITISNNHFSRHNDVMLLGADDKKSRDAIMQVTIAFNHFGKRLIQRMPRCRWGFFHIVNNDYTHWEMYAVGGSANPTILSQGNRYRASPQFDPHHANKEVTKRDNTFTEEEWRQWTWRSDGDVMLNGAFFIESGEPLKSAHPFTGYHMIKAHHGSFVTQLTHFAGALNCHRKTPC